MKTAAIVTQKYLPRRTFLRGAGVVLGLPLLDAMIPALTANSVAAKPVRRMGIVFVPNGIMMENWTPAKEGADFELTPILKSLAPFRRKMLVVSGLDSEPGPGVDFHDRALATWLTGVEPNKKEGKVGISADQIAAKELGKHTQFASLELTAEPTPLGYSYRTPTTPLPLEDNPRALFERLFGDGDSTDPIARQARNLEDRSVLDFVQGSLSALEGELGSRDRTKLDEYFTSIRDIERRIQMAEKQMKEVQLPQITRPAGVPELYPEYVRLMFDLQLAALQTDMTRVWSFSLAKETSNHTYPYIGVPDAHHTCSHHTGRKDRLDALVKINSHHIDLFAYFIEKMDAAKEGNESVLDNSLVLYGSDMSDGNQHSQRNLPLLLLGGAAGQVKGGRHLRYPAGTPVSNLWVTMLDKVGVPVEKLGDSTGPLRHLWDI